MHSGGCGLHKWRTVERIKEWTNLLVVYLGNLNFTNPLSSAYWRTRQRSRRHISRARTRCTKARQEEGLSRALCSSPRSPAVVGDGLLQHTNRQSRIKGNLRHVVNWNTSYLVWRIKHHQKDEEHTSESDLEKDPEENSGNCLASSTKYKEMASMKQNRIS